MCVFFTVIAAITAAGATSGSPLVADQADSRFGSVTMGPYTVQNDEWGLYKPGTQVPSGHQSVETQSASTWSATWVWARDDGRVKSYPSIVRGWNFGKNWSPDPGGFPVQVSAQAPLPTSAAFSLSGDNQYDVAYDLFLSPSPNPDKPSGELMVWLNYNGQQPAGSLVASGVTLGGIDGTYDVWVGDVGWPVWTFVSHRQLTSVDMKLQPFVYFASYTKNWLPHSWYVLDIQAGIEIIAGDGHIDFTRYSASAK